MQCSMRKDRLGRALDACVKALGSKKEADGVTSGVRVTVEGGATTFESTNFDRGVRVRTPALVTSAGRVVVDARKFREVVGELRSDDVTLSLSGGRLLVEAGRQRYKLGLGDVESFPTLPVIDFTRGATMGGAVLAEMVADTAYAVDEPESSRVALRGALWEVDARGFRMVGTNGHRMAIGEVAIGSAALGTAAVGSGTPPGAALGSTVLGSTRLGSPEGGATATPGSGQAPGAHAALQQTLAGSAVVPGTGLDVVLALFADAASVAVARQPIGADGENYLGFQSRATSPAGVTETTLYVRLLVEEYPNWRQVVPKPQEITRVAVLDREALQKAVEGVMVVASAQTKRVVLSLNGVARVSVQTPDLGEADDEVPILDYQGEEIRLGVNGQYLKEALEHTRCPHVQLALSAPERAIVVTGIGAAPPASAEGGSPSEEKEAKGAREKGKGRWTTLTQIVMPLRITE